MTEDKIRELEVKVAFIEDALHKLSDEFFTQQRELEDIKAKYASLVSKFQEVQNNTDERGEVLDERPPHY